jgi:Fe-S cluster biogenesis protein NfuA/nitrite reductase/ring-hydroxylating ferredoxin subunit
LDDGATRERITRVESLLEEVDSLADPAGREMAGALVEALVELYGEGLRRIVDGLEDEGAEALPPAVVDDELVSHLLLLHDLHPVSVEDRVRGALVEVRPYLESHGGGVELVDVADGVVNLRLQGSCSGCPSSTMTLKLAIEEAIHKAAPDIEEVRAEGVIESAPEPAPLLKLEISPALGGPGAAEPEAPAASWAIAGSLAELSGGGLLVKEVSGETLLFIGLEDERYAYRPACPGCEAPLAQARLRGVELACGGCGRTFDVRRAGRCLDEPSLHLEPLPLLTTDAGLTKVALGAAVA